MGVVVCGSCSVWELQCVGVRGSYDVGGCGVGESWCWRVAVWGIEMRGFVDTMTSQASFCLAVTSGFNGFDETKYLVLTLS